MNQELDKLITRIRNELGEVEVALQRVDKGWQSFQQSSDDCSLDSVALNLHGFYSVLKRIFSVIAEVIDNSVKINCNYSAVPSNSLVGGIVQRRPPCSSAKNLDKQGCLSVHGLSSYDKF